MIKLRFSLLIAALAFIGLTTQCSKDDSTSPSASLGGAKVTTVSTPTLSVVSATQASITLRLCAGATGAPAGFSIQWTTKAILDAHGGIWPTDSGTFCKGSFSGNANLSRYNLAANQCVDVKIGEFLFDNGASTNCPSALECGTEYVFRAFAHAKNTMFRSAWTPILTGSTLACESTGQCTYSQGFWKNHGPVPSGNNSNMWPQEVMDNGLMMGTVTYTPMQMLSIFHKPAAGNGLVALAHQLMTAKMNIINGADGSAAAADILAADALIGGLVSPPVGAGLLDPALTGSLINRLEAYNEGGTGPGHCQGE